MNTFQIAQLFRNYCDEPDQSFLTNADVALYCKLAYDEFRQYVDSIDPHILARHIVIQVAGPTYDLTQFNAIATAATTPSVLGVNPNYLPLAGAPHLTWGRMTKLLEVWGMGAGGTVPFQQYHIVNNPAELTAIGTYRVMLRGEYSAATTVSPIIGSSWQTLTFNSTQNQSIKLVISHEQEIGLVYNAVYANGVWEADWTAAITAVGALPLGSMGVVAGLSIAASDGLETWHDIIPLMAYSQYAIADLSANPVLTNRLNQRKKDLREYLQTGAGNAHYVMTSNDTGEIY